MIKNWRSIFRYWIKRYTTPTNVTNKKYSKIFALVILRYSMEANSGMRAIKTSLPSLKKSNKARTIIPKMIPVIILCFNTV